MPKLKTLFWTRTFRRALCMSWNSLVKHRTKFQNYNNYSGDDKKKMCCVFGWTLLLMLVIHYNVHPCCHENHARPGYISYGNSCNFPSCTYFLVSNKKSPDHPHCCCIIQCTSLELKDAEVESQKQKERVPIFEIWLHFFVFKNGWQQFWWQDMGNF